MTPLDRLVDIKLRYGNDSPVVGGLTAAWSELTVAMSVVTNRQREHPVAGRGRVWSD